MTTPILPGATVGILGNGQLGRMLALAAKQMGYRVHTFGPDDDAPADQVADWVTCAAYDDLDAAAEFARAVDVVTFEFENVPAATTAAAAKFAPVRPDGHILHVTQHRLREKTFLRESGFPVTRFAAIRSLEELRATIEAWGEPAILKTAGFGYDGKGQYAIMQPADAEAGWHAIGAQEAVLEAFVPFQREVSVVAARGIDESFAHYGVIENLHHQHILDVSITPARIPPALAWQAIELSHAVLDALNVVGVLCVEFFVVDDEHLLINELAPRPHNSGHLTIEAAVTSQFEQQLRAVCGLSLGSTRMISPAAMANLLGDLWEGGAPDWAAACGLEEVKLHLYGKAQPRIGRKMGHLTALAPTAGEALEHVLAARSALQAKPRPE